MDAVIRNLEHNRGREVPLLHEVWSLGWNHWKAHLLTHLVVPADFSLRPQLRLLAGTHVPSFSMCPGFLTTWWLDFKG